jgi:hypothetical protein
MRIAAAEGGRWAADNNNREEFENSWIFLSVMEAYLATFSKYYSDFLASAYLWHPQNGTDRRPPICAQIASQTDTQIKNGQFVCVSVHR